MTSKSESLVPVFTLEFVVNCPIITNLLCYILNIAPKIFDIKFVRRKRVDQGLQEQEIMLAREEEKMEA